MWQAELLVVLLSLNTPNSSMDHTYYTGYKFKTESRCKEWIEGAEHKRQILGLAKRLKKNDMKLDKIKSIICHPKPLEL